MSKPIAELISDYLDSTETFLAAFSHLDDATFVRQPKKGWSVAEIVEHLHMADKSYAIACLKTQSPPSIHEAAQTQLKIDAYLTQSAQAIKAPDGSEPKGTFTTVANAVAAFTKTRHKLKEIAVSDPQLLAIGFEHPYLGYLTKGQWFELAAWHAYRHTKQIERVLAEFA